MKLYIDAPLIFLGALFLAPEETDLREKLVFFPPPDANLVKDSEVETSLLLAVNWFRRSCRESIVFRLFLVDDYWLVKNEKKNFIR